MNKYLVARYSSVDSYYMWELPEGNFEFFPMSNWISISFKSRRFESEEQANASNILTLAKSGNYSVPAGLHSEMYSGKRFWYISLGAGFRVNNLRDEEKIIKEIQEAYNKLENAVVSIKNRGGKWPTKAVEKAILDKQAALEMKEIFEWRERKAKEAAESRERRAKENLSAIEERVKIAELAAKFTEAERERKAREAAAYQARRDEEEQREKDREAEKRARLDKEIAEYEKKIADMRADVAKYEAEVAYKKTQVGKMFSFTSKADVDKARAKVAEKKADLAKLRARLMELKAKRQ